MTVGSIITIRPMPRMVRTTVMARNLTIGPLGPRRNRHNCIDEGFSPIGEICYTVVYLFRRLLHREYFCKLYLRQRENSLFRVVFTKTLPPIEWLFIDLSIRYRACMSDELSAVEKSVEEVLIDLMAEKVMSAGIQASSTRGVQASPSTARGSGPSRAAAEKRTKHRDDLANVKLIPSILPDYIPAPG
jgi:hypothetical protein